MYFTLITFYSHKFFACNLKNKLSVASENHVPSGLLWIQQGDSTSFATSLLLNGVGRPWSGVATVPLLPASCKGYQDAPDKTEFVCVC